MLLTTMILCLLSVSNGAVLLPEPDKAQSLGFSLKLYREIAKRRDDNIIFSPLGVSTALSMLSEATNGSTAAELHSALRQDQLGLSSLLRDDGYTNLVATLKNGAGYELELANSLWTREDFSLIVPNFLERIRKVYGAEQATFKKGPGIINSWVASRTKGKIPGILRTLDPDTVMLLINAIYFKGTWKNSFNPQDNLIDSFGPGGHQATFMRMKTMFPYRDSDVLKSEILRIPYKGGEMEMVLILPHAERSLSQVERSLTAESLINETGKSTPRNVHLSLPKFKIESDFDLKEVLSDLGIREVFSDSADLSALSPRKDLKVSKVLQKGVIEINEEGSEAAVVTSIGFATRSGFGYNFPIKFHANRPFLFALVHVSTKAMIFFGRVIQP